MRDLYLLEHIVFPVIVGVVVSCVVLAIQKAMGRRGGGKREKPRRDLTDVKIYAGIFFDFAMCTFIFLQLDTWIGGGNPNVLFSAAVGIVVGVIVLIVLWVVDR